MKKFLLASSATFRDLIEGDYLYVDKTRDIYELIQGTKGTYFLSHPRRFGKSLLVSPISVKKKMFLSYLCLNLELLELKIDTGTKP